VRRSPELARRWRPRVLQSHQRLGDVDPNVAAVRVRLLALGLLVAGGTLWVALALPTTHCVRVAADATDCSSWSLIKYAVGVLGLLASAAIVTIARRTEA
jgi:hypothetical protein